MRISMSCGRRRVPRILPAAASLIAIALSLSATLPAPAQAQPVATVAQPIPVRPPNFYTEYLVADPDGTPFPTAFLTAANATVAANGGTMRRLIPGVLVVKAPKDPHTTILAVQSVAQATMSKTLETSFNFPVRLAGPPCAVTQTCQTADPLVPEYYVGPSAIVWPQGVMQTSERANDLMTDDGAATRVAIIDTPAIANEPSELAPIVGGFNIGSGSGGGLFAIGHGTQVSSIVFGQENGIYSQGIAPRAQRFHYGIRVPNLGSVGIGAAQVLLSEVVELFHFLGLTSIPPDVISMSAGLPFGFTPLRRELAQLSDRGVIMFFAAGNESAEECLFPGRYNLPNTICVGATGEVLTSGSVDSFQMAPYSNRGAEIVLPGTNIPVPRINAAGQVVTDIFGNLVYENNSGTSFAAPHAAGIAARILSELRNNPGQYPQVAGMTRVEVAGYVRDLIFSNVTDIGTVGFDADSGHGLPDLVAIHEQMNLDAQPDALPMKQTIQEWDDPVTLGNPIISQLWQRTQTRNPLTKVALDMSRSYGGCVHPLGRLRIGKPKLDVDISNFSGAVTSVSGDQATVDVAYDLRVPIRVKVTYDFPGSLCLPFLQLSFTVQGDWRSPSTGFRNTGQIDLKLDGEGYRVEDVSVTGPETKDLSLSISGLPNFVDQWLLSYAGNIRDIAVPTMRLFEDGVTDHIVQMVERMMNATLSGERETPFAYFHFRRPEPSGGLPMDLDYTGVSDIHTHLAGIGSNQSVFDVDGAALPGQAGLAAVSPPLLGANPNDVTQGIEKNTYAFELDYLKTSGVMSTQVNRQLNATIRTTTESQPDINDAVTVRIGDVQQLITPQLVPDSSSSDHFARMVMVTRAKVQVGTQGTQDVVFVYRPFVSRTSTFKEFERESDFDPAPLELRWEERLVVDPFARSSNPREPVFQLTRFTEEPSVVTPGLPVLSSDEMSEILRATVLNEMHRALGSVSSKRLGLDARLGDRWGCFGPVVEFVNFYTQQLGGALLELREERDCWDLNVGIFGPERTVAMRDLPNHFAHDDTLNLRGTPRDLVPNANTPGIGFTQHPTDNRYWAARMSLSYAASGPADYFYSVNGEWDTPPSMGTNLALVEEAWQATLLRRNGTRFVFIPERVTTVAGEKATVDVIGAARDRRAAHLEVGRCRMRFPIRFAYGRTMFGQAGPLNPAPSYAVNYAQTRVDTGHDTWTNIQTCGSGGGPINEEPVEPVETEFGEGELREPVGGGEGSPPDAEP